MRFAVLVGAVAVSEAAFLQVGGAAAASAALLQAAGCRLSTACCSCSECDRFLHLLGACRTTLCLLPVATFTCRPWC